MCTAWLNGVEADRLIKVPFNHYKTVSSNGVTIRKQKYIRKVSTYKQLELATINSSHN